MRIRSYQAVKLLQEEFPISRATAYRWLKENRLYDSAYVKSKSCPLFFYSQKTILDFINKLKANASHYDKD